MKGYARAIDPLGRIVIPKEIRKSLGIGPGDLLEIDVVTGGILLTPLRAHCVNCGSTENLLMLDEVALCRDCLGQLNATEGRG